MSAGRQTSAASGDGVTISRLDGPDRIDDLEPLFRHLHEGDIAVAPKLGHLPARALAHTWIRRKRRYLEWLSDPDAFVLLAVCGERIVGYVLVSLADGYQSWKSGEMIGEVRDLVVDPRERGEAVGSALMDAVEMVLAGRGIYDYRLDVILANEDAIRFYQSRAMTQVSAVMLGHVRDDYWEAARRR